MRIDSKAELPSINSNSWLRQRGVHLPNLLFVHQEVKLPKKQHVNAMRQSQELREAEVEMDPWKMS